MSLILYLPRHEEAEQQVLGSICKTIPDWMIERFLSITEFSERLRRSMGDVRVAVLYISNRDELMEIIYRGYLLKDLKVILVLSEGDPEMLNKAYELCPRFIAAAESDFKYLGVILKKMMALYETHSEKMI